MAHDIVAVIHDRGLADEGVILMGHSLGGKIAMMVNTRMLIM